MGGVFFRKPTPGQFMMRIRVPNGFATSAQLRAIAEISRRIGNGVLDITTRQQIELRGFTLDSVPEINPLGLAFDGTNMWVTNHGGNSVTKIQVHGPGVNILGTYSVGVQPYGIAFDGTYMWVARSVPVPVRVDPSRAGVPRRRAPSVGVWAAERPDQDHWARHGSC